ncbi:hypothetical protein LCGC14_0561040 [marine sediment metagenome]|uniref:Uncharacterized protein n=1 Tax=marine sediment metagenome TaxID=412755 RepID=A0A0F9UV86_9ZZZZ
MTQAYSDKTRENIDTALPNIEIFPVTQMECNYNLENLDHADEYTITEPGWYWWSCFPGCLPDSEAFGPFDTKEKALEDARDF